MYRVHYKWVDRIKNFWHHRFSWHSGLPKLSLMFCCWIKKDSDLILNLICILIIMIFFFLVEIKKIGSRYVYLQYQFQLNFDNNVRRYKLINCKVIFRSARQQCKYNVGLNQLKFIQCKTFVLSHFLHTIRFVRLCQHNILGNSTIAYRHFISRVVI